MKTEIEIKDGICKKLIINDVDFIGKHVNKFKIEMEAGKIPVLTMSIYPDEEVIIKTDDVKIRKRKIKI